MQKNKKNDTASCEVTPKSEAVNSDHGMKLPQSLKARGFLIASLLMTTYLSLSAQNNETTTTTTTRDVAAPVIQAPTRTTESVSTTKVSSKTRTLYLRSSYQGQVENGNRVYLRPNGRIYGQDSGYVGHLTDLNGEDLKVIPADHRYKIRNSKGDVIASTQLTNAFDSGRMITLARQDSNGHLITEVIETTSTTTVPAVALVPVTPAQSSTTTTTTQSSPVLP